MDPSSPSAPVDEAVLLDGLVARDEEAFVTLIDSYGDSMLRWANLYLGDAAGAEDVVQETWVAVLAGVDRFERRSSLRTWIFRILLNRIRTRQRRDRRQIPFSRYFDRQTEPDEPAVDPDRFLSASHPEWPYHWRQPPRGWGESPEERVLSLEVRSLIDAALVHLPPSQREVITLRDVEGWGAKEVCNVLGITESNQRVLLHRARSRIRGAIERHLGAD